MSIIALLLAFAVMVFLIIKCDWTILMAAIPASLVLVLFDRMNVWEAFSKYFSAGLGSAVTSYFLLLVSGALFGHMMGETGSAMKIALVLIKTLGKHRIGLTLYVLTIIMVYGGISALVIIFTVGPIGLVMAKEAGLPRRFLFAAILGGGGNLAMTSLPGTPSMINIIPTHYLGTNAMATPTLSIISCVVQFIMTMAYLTYLEKRYRKLGMGFEEVEGSRVLTTEDFGDAGLPSAFVAFFPTVILVGFIVLLSDVLGSSTAAAVYGAAIGCGFIYLTNRRRFKKSIGKTIIEGAEGGVLVVANIGAAVGFGVVVKNSSAFVYITDFCDTLTTSGVVGTLFAVFVAVSLFVAATGSTPGGLEIFWENLGDRFIATGVNPQLMHRISTIASGGFDSMPHNAAYPAFNAILGTQFKHTYPLAMVVTLTIPVVACLICILLAGLGIC